MGVFVVGLMGVRQVVKTKNGRMLIVSVGEGSIGEVVVIDSLWLHGRVEVVDADVDVIWLNCNPLMMGGSDIVLLKV